MKKTVLIIVVLFSLALLFKIANREIGDLHPSQDDLSKVDFVPSIEMGGAGSDSDSLTQSSIYRKALDDIEAEVDFDALLELEPEDVLEAIMPLSKAEALAVLKFVLNHWTRRVEVDPLKYPVGSPGVFMFSEESSKVRPLLVSLLLQGEGSLVFDAIDEIALFSGVGPHDKANYELMAKGVATDLGKAAFSSAMPPEDLLVFLEGSGYERYFANAYLTELADDDPSKAAHWASELPGQLPGYVLGDIVAKWGVEDRGDEAIQFISNLPESVDLDRSLSSIASSNLDNEPLVLALLESMKEQRAMDAIRYAQTNHSLKQGDPEKAFHWALTIHDDEMRSTRLNESFEQWADKDRISAVTFLTESDQVDLDLRKTLLRRIELRR